MTASFALRMAIDTPIALQRLLHLDGLLCSLAAAVGGQWDDIPLERYEGIWQGSAAMLEVGPFGPTYFQQMRLKHVRWPRPTADRYRSCRKKGSCRPRRLHEISVAYDVGRAGVAPIVRSPPQSNAEYHGNSLTSFR